MVYVFHNSINALLLRNDLMTDVSRRLLTYDLVFPAQKPGPPLTPSLPPYLPPCPPPFLSRFFTLSCGWMWSRSASVVPRLAII